MRGASLRNIASEFAPLILRRSIMATRSEATTGEARSAKLFGNFSSILGGHEQLGLSLKRLAEMCVSLELGVPPRVSPERLIQALRSEFREHFAAEEAD